MQRKTNGQGKYLGGFTQFLSSCVSHGSAGRSMAPEKIFRCQSASGHNDRWEKLKGTVRPSQSVRIRAQQSSNPSPTAHLCLPACIPLLSAPRVKTEAGMGREVN